MSDGRSPLQRLKGTRAARAIGRRLVRALDERERAGKSPTLRRSGIWSLASPRWLEVLPEPERDELAQTGTVHEIARREALVLDEDDPRAWVLVAGGAKLARVGMAGRRAVEAILQPGDLFGRICVAPEGDAASRASDGVYELHALEPTRALAMPRERFEAVLRRYPALTYSVAQVLEERQRRLVRRIDALVFKDVPARVAETLLDTMREHGAPCTHGFAVDVRLTQDDLAELVGASRQMVNRVLGDFERRLYVQRMGRIVCVLDRERLERLAHRLVHSAADDHVSTR